MGRASNKLKNYIKYLISQPNAELSLVGGSPRPSKMAKGVYLVVGLVTGCGWTRGIGVTGVTGAGTVLIFCTFGHTATCTCGVAGFHRYSHLYSVCSISLTILVLLFSFF
jgi:hypothetical protein